MPDEVIEKLNCDIRAMGISREGLLAEIQALIAVHGLWLEVERFIAAEIVSPTGR